MQNVRFACRVGKTELMAAKAFTLSKWQRKRLLMRERI
jgi:hypothetical protein